MMDEEELKLDFELSVKFELYFLISHENKVYPPKLELVSIHWNL